MHRQPVGASEGNRTVTALCVASEHLSLQRFISIMDMLDIVAFLYTMAVLSLLMDNYAPPAPEEPWPRGRC